MARPSVWIAAAVVVLYSHAIVLPCETPAMVRDLVRVEASPHHESMRNVQTPRVAASKTDHGTVDHPQHQQHSQHPQHPHQHTQDDTPLPSVAASRTTSDSSPHATALQPRCPCGCDEKSRARSPGANLGPLILADIDDTPLPAQDTRAQPLLTLRVGGPLLPPDKVPI
jgi:hypothetical protein